jgi:hypothetical protein
MSSLAIVVCRHCFVSLCRLLDPSAMCGRDMSVGNVGAKRSVLKEEEEVLCSYYYCYG